MCARKVKNILVTGGAGFVGSHLCEKLDALGHKVYCIDNFYTGCFKNIIHLPRIEIIEHDICNPFDLQVDEIYNLACPASPNHYQRDPLFTTRTSVMGALNMLDLAKKHGAKILQASTSEVYGDPAIHPQKESYFGNVNTIGPRACYDEGKRLAETLFYDHKRMYKTDIRVARIFNTYGPRMQEDDGRVVSNFITQALAREALTIYGDGSQTRSFCFVEDLVDGLIALMQSDYTNPMNLGNPDEYSVLTLAQEVLKLTGSLSRIITKPLPEDDPRVRRPDITLAKKHLDWSPKVTLAEGLAKSIAFFQPLVST